MLKIVKRLLKTEQPMSDDSYLHPTAENENQSYAFSNLYVLSRVSSIVSTLPKSDVTKRRENQILKYRSKNS